MSGTVDDGVKREQCRFLPMRFTTRDGWDGNGSTLFWGCVFDKPFGEIAAGEYRAVSVSIETGSVLAVAANGKACYATFRLTPHVATTCAPENNR